MPIDNLQAQDLQLIVPNLHRRYSGVTATNRMVAPKLAKLFRAGWLGPDRPEGIAKIGLACLMKLWRRPAPLIWHARRNNEMIAGVVLRWLGWPLKLVFTSAAQRHHSWITRWLIGKMDAIIATSDISASFLKRKATVIWHGVDTARYVPPTNRASAFAAAGLPGRYGIGCFGRVRAQKGTDLFVEAMCRLLPRYPDFSAIVVGAISPEQQGFLTAQFVRGLRRIDVPPMTTRQRWFEALQRSGYVERRDVPMPPRPAWSDDGPITMPYEVTAAAWRELRRNLMRDSDIEESDLGANQPKL